MPDLAAALNRSLASSGLMPLSQALVRSFVGDGLQALLERGYAHHGCVAHAEALAAFVADYSVHAAVETRAYPGVAEGLQRLRDTGWTLAICTNKAEAAARALLAGLRLSEYFTVVGGGDSFPVRKPDPRHVLATLAAAGGTVDRCVMVGDHHNDIESALGAGVPAIWARWGYGVDVQGAVAAIEGFDWVPAVADAILPA